MGNDYSEAFSQLHFLKLYSAMKSGLLLIALITELMKI